jgi:hypothetical protein
MHSKAAWNDYFTGNPNLIQSNEYKTKPALSDANVYILNCLFISITSSGDGGALQCTSVQNLLIESTSFLYCKTNNNNGGAIFFSNSGSGQCVLNEVCGYDCYSTYTSSSACEQFAYIYVYDVASSRNYVNYSSITRCVNDFSNSYYIMRHYYGNIFYPSANLSMNKCGYRAIFCVPSTDSNYATCSFSYSTFADNIATSYTFFCLPSSSPKFEIKSCNILRNTQSSSSEGTIASWGNLNIKDSCILENRATNIFYQVNSGYTITLSNCTVDSTTNNQNLITQNIVTKSFILALNHMSTRNCHSEYDSAGYLTPNIQSPSSSKKQRQYYTCDEFFHRYQQGNFLSLSSILIFNFIYLYSSGDPLY